MATPENIHTEFHRVLGRDAKEFQLQQRGHVFWLYGLSGSGKSTLANAIERRLNEQGVVTKLLDGDNIRSGLNRDLSFSDEDRKENIRIHRVLHVRNRDKQDFGRFKEVLLLHSVIDDVLSP